MRKYSIKIISFIIWGLVFVPVLAGAALVNCAGPDCHFSDLVTLVKDVLDYILLIAAPIASIMFAYAGFIYLSSQGNPSKRTRANKIFVNVGIGLFFVVGAWLIVKAVLSGLGTDSDYDLLN